MVIANNVKEFKEDFDKEHISKDSEISINYLIENLDNILFGNLKVWSNHFLKLKENLETEKEFLEFIFNDRKTMYLEILKILSKVVKNSSESKIDKNNEEIEKYKNLLFIATKKIIDLHKDKQLNQANME